HKPVGVLAEHSVAATGEVVPIRRRQVPARATGAVPLKLVRNGGDLNVNRMISGVVHQCRGNSGRWDELKVGEIWQGRAAIFNHRECPRLDSAGGNGDVNGGAGSGKAARDI